MKVITFTNRGIYCPIGNFYIDPWKPVDYALITHGHADHARWGMKKYLCHKYTRPILYQRISPEIDCQIVDYNEVLNINGVKVSFHPAGHIIGSSQIRIEYKGYVSLISGDYKPVYDGLSDEFELVRCNEFVTESTFGLPIYNWLPNDELILSMRNWVEKNRADHKTSVFVGYSLGKAQRIMKAVEGMGPINVHYSIGKLNQAFEEVGIQLPSYTIPDFREDVKHLKNQIVILPPALLDSNIIKKIPDAAIGLCSGWMQVRGAKRWRNLDAGFPMSDHADWKGLLDVVKGTEAEIVHVTHGQTEVFSKYLNEIGIKSDVVETLYGDDDEIDQNEFLNTSS